MNEPIPLNLKKRVPKKPKMTPPYNKAQEQERRASQPQHLNDKKENK